MEELCLFLKDNFWSIVLILSMLKYKSTRVCGYILLLLLAPWKANGWIMIVGVIVGIVISAFFSNDSSDDEK